MMFCDLTFSTIQTFRPQGKKKLTVSSSENSRYWPVSSLVLAMAPVDIPDAVDEIVGLGQAEEEEEAGAVSGYKRPGAVSVSGSETPGSGAVAEAETSGFVI